MTHSTSSDALVSCDCSFPYAKSICLPSGQKSPLIIKACITSQWPEASQAGILSYLADITSDKAEKQPVSLPLAEQSIFNSSKAVPSYCSEVVIKFVPRQTFSCYQYLYNDPSNHTSAHPAFNETQSCHYPYALHIHQAMAEQNRAPRLIAIDDLNDGYRMVAMDTETLCSFQRLDLQRLAQQQPDQLVSFLMAAMPVARGLLDLVHCASQTSDSSNDSLAHDSNYNKRNACITLCNIIYNIESISWSKKLLSSYFGQPSDCKHGEPNNNSIGSQNPVPANIAPTDPRIQKQLEPIDPTAVISNQSSSNKDVLVFNDPFSDKDVQVVAPPLQEQEKPAPLPPRRASSGCRGRHRKSLKGCLPSGHRVTFESLEKPLPSSAYRDRSTESFKSPECYIIIDEDDEEIKEITKCIRQSNELLAPMETKNNGMSQNQPFSILESSSRHQDRMMLDKTYQEHHRSKHADSKGQLNNREQPHINVHANSKDQYNGSQQFNSISHYNSNYQANNNAFHSNDKHANSNVHTNGALDSGFNAQQNRMDCLPQTIANQHPADTKPCIKQDPLQHPTDSHDSTNQHNKSTIISLDDAILTDFTVDCSSDVLGIQASIAFGFRKGLDVNNLLSVSWNHDILSFKTSLKKILRGTCLSRSHQRLILDECDRWFILIPTHEAIS